MLRAATAREWQVPDAVGRPRPQPPVHYLLPGQIVVSSDESVVSTVLGSCVSVCLFDPRRNAGGVNHYLLPHAVGRDDHSARYAPVALAQLLEKMCDLGCRAGSLVARVYGGACVLPVTKCPENHLGLRNVRAAREFLMRVGIPVLGEHVGGQRGRRLIFHTHTGEAVVRPL